MKIAILVPFFHPVYSGGLYVQGRMWKDGLEKVGCGSIKVDLVNQWDDHDWDSYDYIMILGVGKNLIDMINILGKISHAKFISAPVIDYTGSIRSFKLRARYYGSVKLRYYKPFHDYFYCKDKFSLYLVRSEHEKKFLAGGMGIQESKIQIVPISLRFHKMNIDLTTRKENFCFHASRLASYDKNVGRLIEAAKRYQFPLVLAGTLNGEQEKQWLNKQIEGVSNIKYVGYLSDDELIDYYNRAKVFALPSLVEGVGMVALEAAACGAEIVLTNLGAPKEYYKGRAVLVDPFNVASIGKGVTKALNGFSQPQLREYILNSYSLEQVSCQLKDILFKYLS